MDDRDRCRECGAKRPADAPDGLCSACRLRAALAGAAPAEGNPGALARLAETLVDVPRVHLLDDEPFSDSGPVVRPASAEMPEPSDRLARLQLLGEVARGGMGVIIKGRDSDLGRDLAVKVLLEQHRENPDLIRRFVEEAQIAGQLQHPGVVPVYELGTLADRRPYFAMKLVKGRTLAEQLKERAGPADDRTRLLGIFEQVGLTMAYAHARGVIHRDLKPSNIMVGSFGEVQVMDWGLAKVLRRGGVADDEASAKVRQQTVIRTDRAGSDAELSQAGSIMGTFAYMPPEQANGEIDRLDERADVFALGSILCEILTGEPAFTGRTAGEIHRKAARGDLAEAFGRLDACGADAELSALARDCLACEPEDRLRNAGVVTERLTAYLAGVETRLRTAELARVEAQTRVEEEAKRRRLHVGLAASVLALTIFGGLAITTTLHQRQARAAQVELALNEATLLHSQALEAPDDLSRWQAAGEAVKRVEVALGGGDNAGGASAQAQLRLGDLRREVDTGSAAARRDRELLDALAEIRSGHLGVKPGVTDMAYAEAFRRAGLDLDFQTPAEAAERLRALPAAVLLQVLPSLDSWSLVRRNDGQPAHRWQRPLAVARAADSDAFRNELRALVERPDMRKQVVALRSLFQDRQIAELPPASVLQLASALREAGDSAAAIALLESSAQRYPGDVWINYHLGEVLAEIPARREDAVRYYTAARALRPESAHNLGHLLDRMGRGEDAIATFRALVEVRPGEARNIGCLGTILLGHQQREEGLKTLDQAIAAARATIERRPADAGEYHLLGYLLAARGDPQGAVAAYRESLRIEPGHTGALTNLVTIMRNGGDQDAIITVLRAAIRARPDHAWSHEALSSALEAKGDRDGAIAEIREAIQLNPDEPAYRTQLAALLKSQSESTTKPPADSSAK
ncbi:MAG: protein kinase [Planctomycetia bacterium]|nr:protein kinase [Planctomycetia bacterium]